MGEIVKIELDGKIFEFFVVEGFEKEKVIDIIKLCQEIGYIIIDFGYKNIGVIFSVIIFFDGEEGILCYCGYLIE